MKSFFAVLSLVIVTAGLVGCETQKTSGLDNELNAPPAGGAAVVESSAQPQKSDNPFEFLAFWKWFESDKPEPTAEEAALARYSEPKKEKNPFAFWEWFSDDEAKEPKPITADDVLSDMSPELKSRAETKYERKIRIARTLDVNGRGIVDDFDRFFLLDRPSRMSLYPTP